MYKTVVKSNKISRRVKIINYNFTVNIVQIITHAYYHDLTVVSIHCFTKFHKRMTLSSNKKTLFLNPPRSRCTCFLIGPETYIFCIYVKFPFLLFIFVYQ